jgi:hypothetical protein
MIFPPSRKRRSMRSRRSFARCRGRIARAFEQLYAALIVHCTTNAAFLPIGDSAAAEFCTRTTLTLEQLLNGGLTVTMDGQTVGRIVTEHQANEADRPPTGSSQFDSRMSPACATGSH